MEEEEQRLAAEKEAARIKAKTLKVSPCYSSSMYIRCPSISPFQSQPNECSVFYSKLIIKTTKVLL